ncbi:MAG: cell division protein FtsZ [Muribaculaceae bacterium]|nr:cell division protein FtsZ [Muribaculaceae bacterium]MDE5844125.1 cell division protein FtsZ [Muribaculaceae bacterium]
MTYDDIAKTDNFISDGPKHTDIKVVGVGGGGGNAVNYMFEQGIKDVSFVICNTDRQHINSSPISTRVLLGPKTCQGLGAGNDPNVARDAAEESVEEIGKIFEDGTKMVFITAGMGGGTGTGAAPIVAREARKRGLLTIGIVTIPFLFEQRKKIIKALEGAEEMSKNVDAMMVINNERLTEIYRDLDFMNAFHKADETLAVAARSISELITTQGHINIDFRDVNTTLRNGGAAIISTGYGEGENRVTKAIEDALNSPLLKDTDIYTSQRFMFNIYYNPNAENAFKMSEADQITAFMTNLDPDVDAIWGVAHDESLGEKIKISILASGFDLTLHGAGETRKINETTKKAEAEAETQQEIPTGVNNSKKLESEYGEKAKEMERQAARNRYIILTPAQMDNESILEIVERTPVYVRNNKIAQEMRRQMENGEAVSAAPTNSPGVNPNDNNPKSGNVISF